MRLPLPWIFCTALIALTTSRAAVETPSFTNATGFANVIRTKRHLRILVSNDDSWASGTLRAFYYALQTAGHQVVVVAPVDDQSGKGGTISIPKRLTLARPGRYSSVRVGASFAGRDDHDAGLNYFAGSPAASVFWALDNIVEKAFNKGKVDLVVTGPNEGLNLGSFKYTLSGTIGASYAAVGRGFSSIAFSADTPARDYASVDYLDINDISVRIATLSANVVTTFAHRLVTENGKRMFPLGIGASVNFDNTSTYASVCDKVDYYHTRLTGGAFTDRVLNNTRTGLPSIHKIHSPAVNKCWNGNCTLPGETTIIHDNNCSASISFYSVDYDAPKSALEEIDQGIDNVISDLNSKVDEQQVGTGPLQLIFSASHSLSVH